MIHFRLRHIKLKECKMSKPSFQLFVNKTDEIDKKTKFYNQYNKIKFTYLHKCILLILFYVLFWYGLSSIQKPNSLISYNPICNPKLPLKLPNKFGALVPINLLSPYYIGYWYPVPK